MKYQWLGQNGLIIYTENKTILIDPYLTDVCSTKRNFPAPKEIYDVEPDIIICTHDHMDHTERGSLEPFLKRKEKKIEVIAPYNSYTHLRSWGYLQHNYLLFAPHTVWTSGDVRITGVRAFHSDLTALGFIIEAEGKKIYISGDTLYNTDILEDLPDDIYAMFVCVNGLGNNMNAQDATEFAKRVNPVKAFPVHWGLFDNLTPDIFKYEKAEYPEFFKIKEL